MIIPFSLSYQIGATIVVGTVVSNNYIYNRRFLFIVSLFQIIHELNSRHLEPVEMFLGVPYAATPGRLQPPAPPARWNGTRLADSLPPVCPQRYPDISNVTAALRLMPKDRYLQLRRLIPLLANQSEDCLRLNIYVPASGKYSTTPPPHPHHHHCG